MDNTVTLPDNLKSRFQRVYVDTRTFTDSAGKTVEYKRLVLAFQVKGMPFSIETKLEQKDISLLGLADTESEQEGAL